MFEPIVLARTVVLALIVAWVLLSGWLIFTTCMFGLANKRLQMQVRGSYYSIGGAVALFAWLMGWLT